MLLAQRSGSEDWYGQPIERKVPRVLQYQRSHPRLLVYKNCDGYIIGKGSSLDNVSKDIFTSPDAIIIAINESIYKIEGLDLSNDIFGLQCDALLRNTCKPNKSPLLISHHIQYFYPKMAKKYVFSYAEHIIHAQSLSAQICLSLMKMIV